MPVQNPAELDNWLGDLNPDSKVVIPEAYAVPPLQSAVLNERFQFERLGMFNDFHLVNLDNLNITHVAIHFVCPIIIF